jgi:hypothetical protein
MTPPCPPPSPSPEERKTAAAEAGKDGIERLICSYYVLYFKSVQDDLRRKSSASPASNF